MDRLFADRDKKILILYDHHEINARTTANYLESFHRYSRHCVSYVSSFAKCRFDLDYFDAVLLHYSVRICHPGFLSNSFLHALRRYRGLKVLFIQDEYENTYSAHRSIRELGIKLVFSCVPEISLARVYPPEQFPGVKFVTILTGYVPLELNQMQRFGPIRERPVLIGYRGRSLGYWYGDLGQEKQIIGQRMKEICVSRGLKIDIAWEEKDRIYGDRWYRFLGSCKATLGTESGSNIFDFDGTLKAAILDEIRRNPTITYEEIGRKYLRGRESVPTMNQISPKVFEAIACRTALVLFEGNYSGVLEPGKHYLALKKDFGNVDEVLARLQDDDYLETMTRNAYDDVIGSGRYSYEAFVRLVDGTLEPHWGRGTASAPAWLPLPPCDALPDFRDSYRKNFEPPTLKRMWRRMPGWIRSAVNRDRLKRLWLTMPESVRRVVEPFLQKIRSIAKPPY